MLKDLLIEMWTLLQLSDKQPGLNWHGAQIHTSVYLSAIFLLMLGVAKSSKVNLALFPFHMVATLKKTVQMK